MTVVDHVKLFRNRPDLRFEHRIHEQILRAIRRAGGEVEFTDIHVVHSGSDHSPQMRQRKLERDLRIFKQDLAERPEHPFILFNLGMTFADVARYDEAVEYLKRCVEVSRPEEFHVRKAYALYVNALAELDRFDEAERICDEGLAHYGDDKELLFRRAMLCHHRRDFEAAIELYERVLGDTTERHYTSIDPGVTGYKARHNLAVLYGETERWDLAEAEWRIVVLEQPRYRDGWRRLGETLLTQGKTEEAEQLATLLQTSDAPSLRASPLCAWPIARRADRAAADVSPPRLQPRARHRQPA